MTVAFTVYGHPTPQGSTKAFIPKGWKRPVITTDNKKLKPWRQQVSGAALNAVSHQELAMGAIEIHMDFYFDKPKSLSKRILHKTTKPDIDKLERGILDALTGVVFKDDSQVVRVVKSKRFGLPERVEIEVFSLPGSKEEQIASLRSEIESLLADSRPVQPEIKQEGLF